MRIFLSYPSEEHATVEQVALALRNSGHHVFLDKDDLPPGLDFNEQISKAIDSSDMMIFFITPESVGDGRFTRSELAFARKRWPGPAGKVLPVMLRQTSMDAVPAYLKSVHIFEPQGNLAAEVRSEVARYGGVAKASKLSAWSRPVAVIGLGILAVAGAFAALTPSTVPLPVAPPETSLACLYSSGPKAGMTEVASWGTPAPVGFPCLDNLGSMGTFVSQSTVITARGIDKSRFTKACQFHTGPRQGQSATLSLALYFGIGTPCHDGAGSIGIGIKE